MDKEVSERPFGQPALAVPVEPASGLAPSGFDQAQGRDHRGRFLKKLRHTPEGSCEWLIWSNYWRAWHRKSSTGGAAGYTDDIAEAGLFPRSKAAAYNDDRDTPFHVTEKLAAIKRAIAEHDGKLAKLNAAITASERLTEIAEHRADCARDEKMVRDWEAGQ